MPLVDRRTNSVVLRIVYDGPPEAGKATNLKQLCERLSLRRPGVKDLGHERALYLDWLDPTGGWIGGPRVRCQLVNVPRQLQLAQRGRYILDSADAVVFVADSRVCAAPRTKAALRSLVRGLGHRSDVPLVLQANKQDLPDAQPPSDLHHALGLAARVPVIPAQASGGAGVVETFTVAVRVAVDHVRARLVAGELGGDAINGNEPLFTLDAIPEVFDELEAIASAADAAATRRSPPASPATFTPPPPPDPGSPLEMALAQVSDMAEWDRLPTQTDLPPVSDSDPTQDAPPVKPGGPAPHGGSIALVEVIELPATPAEVAAMSEPTFARLGTPQLEPFQLPTRELPPGLVWPGVSGRAALASLPPPTGVTTVPAPWAPAAAIELACGGRWLAHTSSGLLFTSLDDARRTLLEAIRWQTQLSHLSPPGRTYALAPQPDGARLWLLTPVHRTVWIAIEEAFARGDRGTAARLARLGLEAVDEIRARGAAVGDLDHIAIDDPLRLLTTPWTPRTERLAAQLQRLFAEEVL